MVFGLFTSKKRVDILREEVQESFKHVRKDVNKISDWIDYIDDKEKKRGAKEKTLQQDVEDLKQAINEIQEAIQFFGQAPNRQKQNAEHKHTNTQTRTPERQTGSQTAVQTEDLEQLTVMERAIVWALMNAEMKLSYEDIAALLGKDKSTIRGQVNSIKQKIPNLIYVVQEQNSKKRLYIEEEVKKSVAKKTKLKVKN